IWFGIFLLTAVYLVRQGLKGGLARIGRGRLVCGLATLVLALYFLYGAVGNPLSAFMSNFEPGYSKSDVPRHTVVYEDYDKAITVAKAKQKKVLVNFTGLT
ncbi:MAG: hypothetical protein V3U11_02000, partial [Planctomycetota bacterium]